MCRNSLRGVKEQELLSVMTDRGMSDDSARELIREVKLNPIFQAAQPVSWRVRNLEALLNVHLTLAEQNKGHFLVDRRRGLAREDFHRKYYVVNKPVVLEGLMDSWPALACWSPEYFRERIGDVMIEIQSSRKSSPVYEVFLKGHTRTVSMAEFVNMVLEGGTTNEFYLTANDRFLDRPGVDVLLKDFWPFPEYGCTQGQAILVVWSPWYCLTSPSRPPQRIDDSGLWEKASEVDPQLCPTHDLQLRELLQ